jgi:tetratricopeptide (TPR) repeat protein
MGYENRQNFSRIYLKAHSAYDKSKYREAISYCDLAEEIAKYNKNLDDQILVTWLGASCWEEIEEYETALTKYTWLTSNIENTEIKLGRNTLSIIIRSFCDWVGCAAQVPSFDEQGLMGIFDEGERYMYLNGYDEMKAEFFHCKSLALRALRLYEEAMLIAEEGLALKKLNPHSPGCDVKHHTEVYADILCSLSRFDDAIDTMTCLIDVYPHEDSTWAGRAKIYLRKGEYALAIKDYTESLFQVASAQNHRRRAIAHALSGDTERAVEEFRNALKEDAHDPYAPLWLAGITKTKSRLKPLAEMNGWISNIAKFYLGDLDKEGLLNLMTSISSRRSRRDRLCKCYTYIGLFYEGRGEMNLAKHNYHMSVNTKAISEDQYVWAEARLKQLEWVEDYDSPNRNN